jgi:general secretion pathway protein F
MSVPNRAPDTGTVTLETLIALNDEIVALARSGIPMELGLREFGEDHRGALGRISNELAARMSTGESLADAIAAGGDRFPAVYGRVIEAGIRAGRLPAALEAVSRFAWEMVDLRRRIGLAMLYPLIVLLLAYGLFMVVLAELVVRYRETYESLQIPVPELLQFLSRVGDTAYLWGWLPPVLLIGGVLWWIVAPDIWLFRLEGPSWPLTWIPGLKWITSSYRYANFAELTALLVEHEVPLPEAIELAADATGDWSIQHAAHVIAEELIQGGEIAAPKSSGGGLPPFLNWMLERSQASGELARSLRLAATMYRDRAKARVDWLKTVFPIVAAVLIGGGAVLLYALSLFYPLTRMLGDLAAP